MEQSYTSRVIGIDDIFKIMDEDVCAHCGLPQRGIKERGPLAWRPEPDEIFWYGKRIQNITKTEARLISLMIRYPNLKKESLFLALPGENTMVKTMDVYISNIRRKLKNHCDGRVTIEYSGYNGYYNIVVK